MSPLPIAVLASGGGTNLQALIDHVHGREAEIVAVASDVPGAGALDRARAAGIEHATFPCLDGEDRDGRDRRIADWLSERGTRLVVLAGYLRLVGPPLLDRFPDAIINVHPSLLPAFPGLHAIEQALAYGVKVFGVTVHLVDGGLDSGPVILQRAIEIPGVEDPDLVLERLRPLEYTLLPEAVRLFAHGTVRREQGNPRNLLFVRG